jgi:hypothetical protein
VFTYSDDFRLASESLGDARAALDECAMEVRTLGLVLNEHKTFGVLTKLPDQPSCNI